MDNLEGLAGRDEVYWNRRKQCPEPSSTFFHSGFLRDFVAEQDQRFVPAFGSCILNERHSLPLARFSRYDQLDVVLLKRFDLLLRARSPGKKRNPGHLHCRVTDDTDRACPGGGLKFRGNLLNTRGRKSGA